MSRWVDVDVQDVPLRQTLYECLQHLDLHDPQGEATVPTVVLKDSAEGEENLDTPVVRVCLGREPRGISNLENPFANSAVHHYVAARPEPDPHEIWSAVRQIAEGGIIGIEELVPPQADVYWAKELTSERREHHTDVLRRFFDRPQVPPYVHENLARGFEELFTNAVYDAPRDERGHALNAHLPRSVAVTSPRPFEVRFVVSEDVACIAVRDAYGGLDPTRVLLRLRACFGPQGAAVEEKRGGAGLGIFLTLQSCSRMVINLAPGQFTEVIAVHRLYRRRRDFQSSSLSLSLCVTS